MCGFLFVVLCCWFWGLGALFVCLFFPFAFLAFCLFGLSATGFSGPGACLFGTILAGRREGGGSCTSFNVKSLPYASFFIF